MNKINHLNHSNVFVLSKMTWQMMRISCMCIEFILVGINYMVIGDMLQMNSGLTSEKTNKIGLVPDLFPHIARAFYEI
jgi:hypothetical protein